MLRKVFMVSAFVSIVFALSCSSVEAPLITEGNRAIITDRIGREWDVTHARDAYAMNPDYFNYGLGIGAIPSVDEPTVLEEEDFRRSSLKTRIHLTIWLSLPGIRNGKSNQDTSTTCSL